MRERGTREITLSLLSWRYEKGDGLWVSAWRFFQSSPRTFPLTYHRRSHPAGPLSHQPEHLGNRPGRGSGPEKKC